MSGSKAAQLGSLHLYHLYRGVSEDAPGVDGGLCLPCRSAWLLKNRRKSRGPTPEASMPDFTSPRPLAGVIYVTGLLRENRPSHAAVADPVIPA